LKKLTPTDLNNFDIEKIVQSAKLDDLSEKSSSLFKDTKGAIGQEKAIEALKFGLFMEQKNYNIYVAGSAGCGKKTLALKLAKELAEKRQAPPDLCYVYNFENPKTPKLLKLEKGLGEIFKKDMSSLVEDLTYILTEVIKGDEYEEAKSKIIKKFEDRRETLINIITEKAKLQNFEVKHSDTGIYFLPIIDEKAVSEEDFSELEEEQQQRILEESKNLKKLLSPIMAKIKSFEAEVRKSITELEYEKLLFKIGSYIGELLIKYEKYEDIVDYLKQAKEDMLENLELFTYEADSSEEEMLMMMPWASKKDAENPLEKYKVNVIVNNKELEHAPVIFLNTAGYRDIVGEIEYDNEYGNYTTDFTKIRAGALHKANGGYLIIYVHDINYLALDALFTALKREKAIIEPIREFQTITLNMINPEPLNLDLKVILLGDYYIYNVLSYDENFKKLFKIRAEFDHEMDFQKNAHKVLSFIKNNANLTEEAEIEFIRFLMREAGKKNKLTADFNLAKQILEEAATWAKIEGKEVVTLELLKKALKARDNRHNLYEEKLTEMIENGTLLLEASGSRVGQINGLAVIDMEEYAFAKPSKITATCYTGENGIINIEKEARLSGKLHDKGVHILTGYIGSTYAKESPISVSIRIAFEQNYSGIDGDSASSTEAYAIISAISELPLSQELAVTGSMNQFGHIQPIGGVTEKIEGFFDTCKSLGLTGNQGVLIPYTNINDLMLKSEVIEAVEKDEFHIYAVKHIEEGLELLMGMPIDKINAKVMENLKKYSKSSDNNKKTKRT